MHRIVYCALGFGLLSVLTAWCLIRDDRLDRLDPVSGLPRLTADEKHVPYGVDGTGPWVVTNGVDTELICMNGKRTRLRRGSFFIDNPVQLMYAGLPEFPAEDFPLFRSRDEYTQDIIRCRDGEILWSGPVK